MLYQGHTLDANVVTGPRKFTLKSSVCDKHELGKVCFTSARNRLMVESTQDGRVETCLCTAAETAVIAIKLQKRDEMVIYTCLSVLVNWLSKRMRWCKQLLVMIDQLIAMRPTSG